MKPKPLTHSFRLYDIVKGRLIPFQPLNPNHVKMYVCGPTVYDYIHVGNARSIVVFDTLYRWLQYLFPRVDYARNITDIDDKIIYQAKKLNISPKSLTCDMIKTFHKDIKRLNCLPPTVEPKASEHIQSMIQFIERMIKMEYAYVLDGNVIFDTISYPKYFDFLANQRLQYGKRIHVDSNKKDPHDFYLWKKISVEELGYESPWGYGRPGWHTECVVMSSRYLGDSFDIHGGGIDLIFPHHHNEWVQAKVLKKDFTHTWVHNGFINFSGEKMSKSLGNVYYAKEIMDSYSGLALRLYLLQTHYSKPLDFSYEGLKAAETLLIRFLHFYVQFESKFLSPKNHSDSNLYNLNPLSNVTQALCDNLNTPLALRHIIDSIKKIQQHAQEDKKNIQFNLQQIRDSFALLGLDLMPFVISQQDILKDQTIQTYIKDRNKAKENKDFVEADSIRKKLLKHHILIEDTKSGSFLVSLKAIKS